MILFESARLQLKVFSEEDVDAAMLFWGDAEVMQHCGGETPSELIANVLAAYQKCQDVNGISVYGVVEKSSGEVIGAAGFNVYETVENVELIYHFSKGSWGHGYATEAAKACIALAEKHEGIQTIYASASLENEASKKILERIGFQFVEVKWFDDLQQNEAYFECKIR